MIKCWDGSVEIAGGRTGEQLGCGGMQCWRYGQAGIANEGARAVHSAPDVQVAYSCPGNRASVRLAPNDAHSSSVSFTICFAAPSLNATHANGCRCAPPQASQLAMLPQYVGDGTALRGLSACCCAPTHDVPQVVQQYSVGPSSEQRCAPGRVAHVASVARDGRDDVGVGRHLLQRQRLDGHHRVVARVHHQHRPGDVGYVRVNRGPRVVLMHVAQAPQGYKDGLLVSAEEAAKGVPN
mmetsp:Transcript_32874/g.106299  ORF Transcript_32874/g.106299 Transcript_32874/m.106299 type:complete len:238 (+) Transcript_32874:923-1636(+)